MREGWNVVIRHDEDIAGTSIWFIHKQGEQETVVNPLAMTLTTTLAPNALPPLPSISIRRTEAHQFLQGLAEALVEAGFRPDELKAKEGELGAVRYHLEDMRLLVMQALLPPELPSVPYMREKR